MAINKQKKEQVVAELQDLFTNAKSVVFSDYKGISVKDFGTLRGKLRENEVNFKVAKKTLIKIAAEKAGFKDLPEEVLEGQVGAAFGMSDEVAAAKTLFEFSKSNESIKLLGAIMEGRNLSQEETLELAKIPGKDELLAKLVGSMNAPISGFHGILSSLLRNFVGVVGAYKDKLEKEGPAVEEKTEVAQAPAEPAKEEAKPEEKPAEAAPEAPAAEEEKTEEPAKEEAPKEEAKEPVAEEAPKEEAPAEEKAEAPAEEKAEEAPAKEEEKKEDN
jgi:large subunit ribosomal protein L10